MFKNKVPGFQNTHVIVLSTINQLPYVSPMYFTDTFPFLFILLNQLSQKLLNLTDLFCNKSANKTNSFLQLYTKSRNKI